MKKRTGIVILIVILALLGGVILVLHDFKKTIDIGEFDVTRYQWEMETFASDKNTGPIDSAYTAIEKAKELWIEELSEINGQPYDPINGRTIEVSYDSQKQCWLINGTLPSNTIGAVPHALIQKDGKVLAVWMG